MKLLHCLFVSVFLCVRLSSVPDPFSKITVKSQKAVFARDKDDKSIIHLTYNDDVYVTFADSTTVSSDKLELFARTKKPNAQVEKVVFTKNVCMRRKNQKVKADTVEVFVEEKRCELSGNVFVEQIKDKERDVPITTACERAQLRWDCEEITLVGSEQAPVCTTIELGGRARVLQTRVSETRASETRLSKKNKQKGTT